MVKNLYAILGIKKTAGPEAVKKAYRRQSRKAHPDMGGSTEAFADVKLAYSVLGDEGRRARYDSTGEYEESKPDNQDRHAWEFVFKCLDAVLGEMSKTGLTPSETDMKANLVSSLKKTRCEVDNKAQGIHRGLVLWKQMKGRLVASDNDQTLEIMIDRTVAALNQQLEGCDKQKAILGIALKLMDKFSMKDWNAAKGMSIHLRRQSTATLFLDFGR